MIAHAAAIKYAILYFAVMQGASILIVHQILAYPEYLTRSRVSYKSAT